MTLTPGTLYKFRRNDLIAACERMSQQARPKAFRRMTKDDLQAVVLRVALTVPEFAAEVARMADRLERPGGAVSRRQIAAALGPCGK